jgi:hypothetical protein
MPAVSLRIAELVLLFLDFALNTRAVSEAAKW